MYELSSFAKDNDAPTIADRGGVNGKIGMVPGGIEPPLPT